MISKTAVWLFDTNHCRPYRRSHTSIGGPTIPLRQPRSNFAKHWSWSGSSPHNTRMHQYSLLTTFQKDQWKALADTLNNGHSTVSPGPYSGAIAYMVVNLYRRLNGQPYDDEAPADAPPADSLAGIIQVINSNPRQFVAELQH